MINRQQVLDIIENSLNADGYFLVDLEVKSSKKIIVLIDSENGVPIEYCVSLSRLIREALGETMDEYELEVSSPGLGQPLKVIEQFHKCLNKEVEVVMKDGIKHKGTLDFVSDDCIKISVEEKVKIPGRKKKEIEVKEYNFSFEEIKTVKETIKF